MDTQCPHGYVETPALQKVLDSLHKPGVCLILGLPGHGKSTLALQAMARLASTDNVIPVHLTDPSEWNWIPPPQTGNSSTQPRKKASKGDRFRNDVDSLLKISAEDTDSPPPGKKVKLSHDGDQTPTPSQSHGTPAQNAHTSHSSVVPSPPHGPKTYVALIDDTFGKGNFDQQKYQGWEDKFSHLEAKVRDGQVKLILVSRTHIYQNCKDSLVQHSLLTLTEKVDLNDPTFWTKEGLLSILKSFLRHHNVSLKVCPWDMYEICSSCQNIGFPQCCHYFVTNVQTREKGLSFFKKPLEFLRLQFQTMRKKDRKSYAVLVLTLMEEGSISLVPPFTESLLKNFERMKQFIPTDGVSLPELNEAASSLANVYLSRGKTPGSFTFCHQTVWDCLMIALCEADFESTVKTCSTQQLCEYIRTAVTPTDQAELLYIVPEIQWPLLAARLARELASGNLKRALDHPCLRDDAFRRDLESACSDPSLTRQILLREHEGQFDVSLRVYDHAYCTVEENAFLIEHETAVGEIVKQFPRLARKLIESDTFGDLPVPNKDLILKEAVESACLKADWELIPILMEKEAPVTGKAVLIAASSSLSEEMMKWLLYRMPATLSVYQELLFHALAVDKVTIFQCLTSCSSQTRSRFQRKTLRGENFLHITAICGSTRILQWLVEDYPSEKRPQWISTQDLEGSTPLHRAIESGHFSVVQLLLNYGADPDITDKFGRCPLHVCACNCENTKDNGSDTRRSDICHEEILKTLIDMTCDINTEDNSGSSPLLAALQKGNATLASLLLQNERAEVDTADQTERTALHWCASSWEALSRHSSCKSKNKNPVEPSELLKSIICKTTDVNTADAKGTTPLYLALTEGHIEAVEILLIHKADPNTAGEKGMRPLHVALTKGHPKAIEILLIHGADPNTADDEGMRPLHVALWEGHADAAELLLTHGADPNLLDSITQGNALYWCIQGWRNITARHGNERSLALLFNIIAKTKDVNMQDTRDNTPFRLALKGKYDEAAIMLFLNRSNVNSTDQNCESIAETLFSHILSTPEQQRSMDDHLSFLQRLLKSIKHEAMSELVDSKGRSLLHIVCAVEKQSTRSHEAAAAVVQMVVEKSSEILNKQDHEGNSALHVAATQRDYVTMHLLLQHGASTELVDAQGRTALHVLAGRSFDSDHWPEEMELWEKMLTSSNVNIQDHHGHTALHTAATVGNKPLLNLLLEKGVKSCLQDDSGQIALTSLFRFLFPQIDEKFFDAETEVLKWKERFSTVMFRDVHENNDHTLEWTKLVLAYLACCHWHKTRTELVDASGQTVLHFLVGVCAEDSRAAQPNPVKGEWDSECKEAWRLLSNRMLHLVNHQSSADGTILHRAATRIDWSLLHTHLTAGARDDLVDEDGQTALHRLAGENCSKPFPEKEKAVWELLVQATNDINLQDSQGRTVLHKAAHYRNLDLMEILLKSGARADIQDAKGQTALHCYCDKYDVGQTHFLTEEEEAVWKLLVQATNDINLQDSQGSTVLHKAACYMNLDLMEILLNSGARADIQDAKGRTALHCYCDAHYMLLTFSLTEEEKAVWKQLVQATNNINLQDSRGRTVLHRAACNSITTNLDLMGILLESGARADILDAEGQTAFHHFINTYNADLLGLLPGDEEYVTKLLVQATNNINLQDMFGNTVLHRAACCRNLSVMEILLKSGAKADILNCFDETALHYFFDENEESHFDTLTAEEDDVWELLVQATNNINLQDMFGSTVLHRAACCRNLDLMGILLRSGARADIMDMFHKTALHSYCDKIDESQFNSLTEEEEAVWKLLVQATNDINLQDSQGRTVLHIAACCGNLDLMGILLKSLARADIQDAEGQTALHCYFQWHYEFLLFSITKKKKAVWKLLVQATKINLQDSQGRAVLHEAATWGSLDLMEILLNSGARADPLDTDKQMLFHYLFFVSDRFDSEENCERLLRPLLEGTSQTSQSAPEQLSTSSSALPGNNSSMEVVEDADVLNFQSAQGVTPLHYAAYWGVDSVAKLLLSYGARPDVQDKEGKTPWDIWKEELENEGAETEETEETEEFLTI